MSDLALFLGQALIVTAAIAALVMGVSLFFKWLPRVGPEQPGIKVRSAAELFEEGRFYDVLLSSGQRLTALRFEGIVQADTEAGWSLRQLAVMRRADGGKVILRIDAVRVRGSRASGPRKLGSHGGADRALRLWSAGTTETLSRQPARGNGATAVPGGLVLREALRPGLGLDAAIDRVEALALAQGVHYDGHGQAIQDGEQGQGLDIQFRTFPDRTGIAAGHGFALPLPAGRFRHAVHLGSDRLGRLPLDISALVTDRP